LEQQVGRKVRSGDGPNNLQDSASCRRPCSSPPIRWPAIHLTLSPVRPHRAPRLTTLPVDVEPERPARRCRTVRNRATFAPDPRVMLKTIQDEAIRRKRRDHVVDAKPLRRDSDVVRWPITAAAWNRSRLLCLGSSANSTRGRRW